MGSSHISNSIMGIPKMLCSKVSTGSNQNHWSELTAVSFQIAFMEMITLNAHSDINLKKLNEKVSVKDSKTQ